MLRRRVVNADNRTDYIQEKDDVVQANAAPTPVAARPLALTPRVMPSSKRNHTRVSRPTASALTGLKEERIVNSDT